MAEWVAQADEVVAEHLNHLRVQFLGGALDDSAPGRKFPPSESNRLLGNRFQAYL